MFSKLIDWSKAEYAQLPWRQQRSLYNTLVSEIMLQQTTVATVLRHFPRFIAQYPDLKSLAKSTEEEICIAWKGLGYYRRARNLRKAAQALVEQHKGIIPLDYQALVKIPGIGAYTANALLAIGGNQTALALDANLERVIARLHCLDFSKGPKLQKAIQAQFEAGKILKTHRDCQPRELNEALMDLGRVYCQANQAACLTCPLQKSCQSFKQGTQLSYPLAATEKVAKFFELDLVRVLVKKQQKILTYQKAENQWLSGQYEIPTFIVRSEDKQLGQYPMLSKANLELDSAPSYKTSITKYKIKNYVITLDEKQFFKQFPKAENYVFIPFDKTNQNFTTASLKAFKYLNE